MIELKNVSKSFLMKNGESYKVLDNISCTFQADRKYAILGKNGSGKSTLISLIAGIQKADKGSTITKNIKTSWPVGFGGNFQGSLTGRENLDFICRIFGKSGQDKKEIMEYCKSWTDLGKHFDEPIKQYSSGMKARLAFAASMAFDFDFYLMDEVTSTGDMFFAKKAKQVLIEKLKDKGFIIVSHLIGDIANICTDFGVMTNKKLIFYEKFEDAFKAYKGQA